VIVVFVESVVVRHGADVHRMRRGQTRPWHAHPHGG
jgi:hypothetical protein